MNISWKSLREVVEEINFGENISLLEDEQDDFLEFEELDR